MEKREKLRYFLWTFIGILVLIGLASGYGKLIDSDSTCSILGSCSNVVYLNYSNVGNLTIIGNSSFDGHLMPITSLIWDIGSGPNRWRNIYGTNLSIDYIDAIGNITTAEYFVGSGAFLVNLNVSGNFTGSINSSNILNEYWVDESGDTMTGTLVTPEVSTDCVSGGNIEFGQCGVNVRLNLTSGGNFYGIGPWDTDDSMSANSLVIRNSRSVPNLISVINRSGLYIFDNSASDNTMIRMDLQGNYVGVGNVTASHFFGDGSHLTGIAAGVEVPRWLNNSNSLYINSSYPQNITIADWFKGKFNWTSADDYNIFNGSILDFNESKMNDTIDARGAGDNATWNQSKADTLYAPNTTLGIQVLSNLTEDDVEAYIFDNDNTANLNMSHYNITGIDCFFFKSGGSWCSA